LERKIRKGARENTGNVTEKVRRRKEKGGTEVSVKG
jgi:hypothetical protein